MRTKLGKYIKPKPLPGRRRTGEALACGFYPFWFWNDTLSREEIIRQIDEMAGQGVKGFHIHSRQGLGQPYLAKEFFEMVAVAVRAAAARGMSVHLYDEFPYPSGVAGGEVVLGNPEFLATKLVQQSFDAAGGAVRRILPRGRLLCCRAYRITPAGAVNWQSERDLADAVGIAMTEESFYNGGLTSYSPGRYFMSNPTPLLSATLPAGRWRVFVAVQVIIENHKYWGYFADVLNPAAIRHFIRLTHERYRQRIGACFGKSVRTFFVDETTPNWSSRLPAWFQAKYGYSLTDSLPALQDPAHPRHWRVTRDLWELRYERFCQAFERPIRDWCAMHAVGYAGEKPSLRLAQLQYMDIPGCDAGHAKVGAPLDLLGSSIRSNARAAASAAYFYGKAGALCECGHSLGWSVTLQDLKRITEGLLLMGVSYIVPHAFFYSTHALRKHDAPPSFFFQMPFWPLFGELSKRVCKLGEQFAGTRIDAQVLVVEPSPGFPDQQDLQAYTDLLQALMEAQLDFLIVDTDILARARIAQGRACIRRIAASLVVVPPMRAMEPRLAKWLAGFAARGGRILRCGKHPDLSALRRQALKAVAPHFRFTAEQGSARQVWMVTRRRGDQQLRFLLNTGGTPVRLRLGASRALREIPLADGVPPLLETAKDGYRRELAAWESLLLTTAVKKPTRSAPVAHLKIAVEGECRVTPLGPNLLRLADWDMCLIDKGGREGLKARVPAIPLANQLKLAGLPFTPDVQESFGLAPRFLLPRLRVRYRAAFNCDFTGPVALVMEPGSIGGEWTIGVNGVELRPQDLVGTDAFMRGWVGCEITARLKRGRNVLSVEVSTDRPDGGLLNPLYLSGRFGVRLDPLGIVAPRRRGAFEAYAANGLPFYAGVIEYDRTFDAPRLSASQALVEVKFDRPFQDACAVSVNGGAFRPLPWSPRRVMIPSRELRAGSNQIRLRVYTSLVRAFEGLAFDIKAHCLRPVRAEA